MDPKRRRRKQQEKKSPPSYIRRKRSSSKTTQKRKSVPAVEPRIRNTKNQSVKSTKKNTIKKSTVSAKPRTLQNLQLDVKDGWIKLLIFIFIVVNGFLVYNLIKQWSASQVIPKSITPKSEDIVTKKQETKNLVDSAPLQIEVLNGCGVSGIAAEFTEYLRRQGFDVVKTDNYESFNVLETVIIDRRNKTERITKIAKSLGLDSSRILKEINEAYLIDATVILGKDYKRLSSWKKMEHNDF